MNDNEKNRVIFVSGLSGAGKSVVLNTLEDLNFYCIDNFPIGLLDNLSDQLHQYPKLIAIGINARNQETKIPSLTESIKQFKNNNIEAELIYLEADNDILTKRYSETRRKHPFSSEDMPLHDAIENEYKFLTPLAESADLKIDTSHTTVHDLRKLISQRVAGRSFNDLSIQLISFGYKHGTPRDADFVFDVRCLPNPYWEKNLRSYSGKDKDVIEFLQNQPLVSKMADQLISFLSEWLIQFEAEGRSYLTIAVGCTGGRHRSVYLIDRLAENITASGRQVIIRHRDL